MPGTTPSTTLALTGSPGTGKKSIAPLVASMLGLRLLDLNGIALSLTGVRRSRGIVDTARLRKGILRLGLGGSLVSGHLVPDVMKTGEAVFVAVLRCEPSVLRSRLEKRGYPHGTLVQNLEAELIGVVMDESVRRFGSEVVHEYDTTRSSPRAVAQKIAGDYKRHTPPREPRIDWTLRYDSSSKLRSLLSPSARMEPAST